MCVRLTKAPMAFKRLASSFFQSSARGETRERCKHKNLEESNCLDMMMNTSTVGGLTLLEASMIVEF